MILYSSLKYEKWTTVLNLLKKIFAVNWDWNWEDKLLIVEIIQVSGALKLVLLEVLENGKIPDPSIYNTHQIKNKKCDEKINEIEKMLYF